MKQSESLLIIISLNYLMVKDQKWVFSEKTEVKNV